MKRWSPPVLVLLAGCAGAGAQSPPAQTPAPATPAEAQASTDTFSFDRAQYVSTYRRRENPPVLIRNVTVFTGAGPEQARELWVVRLDGRAPVKLELAAPVSDFRLHPDGRRIAFTARQRRSEVWLLQNFLPTER